MAVSKLWPVRSRLTRVILYVSDEKKTNIEVTRARKEFRERQPDFGPLEEVLSYAGNASKTDHQLFISGINCCPHTAAAEFEVTKLQFAKTEGILAYHGYLSFSPGEVTPEQAHEIGMEYARRVWGDRFQVVVTTHLNTDCIHDHFVVNSVSFVDGRRLQNLEKAWFRNRKIVDEICRERGLSVVEEPERNADSEFLKRKEAEGEPTRYSLARKAIDDAIACSRNMQDFKAALTKAGYRYQMSPGRKYWTIIPRGMEKPIRLYRLGEEYTNIRIMERLKENLEKAELCLKSGGDAFIMESFQPASGQKKRKEMELYQLLGPRRRGSIYNLYLHYCYRLGCYPEKRWKSKEEWKQELQNHRIHVLLHDDLLKMDEYSEEIRFLARHGIETEADLFSRAAELQEMLGEKKALQRELANQMRRKIPETEKLEINEQRKAVSGEARKLRKEVQISDRISAKLSVMEERLQKIEEEEQREKDKERRR